MSIVTLDWGQAVQRASEAGLSFTNEDDAGNSSTLVTSATANGESLIEYEVTWSGRDPIGGETIRVDYDDQAGSYKDATNARIITFSKTFLGCYLHTPLNSISTLAHFFTMEEEDGLIITDQKAGVVCEPTEISFDTFTVRPHEPLSRSTNGQGNGIPSLPIRSDPGDGVWEDFGTSGYALLIVAVLDLGDTQGSPQAGDTANFKIGDRKLAGDVLPGMTAGISVDNVDLGGGPNTNNPALPADDTNTDYHYVARPTEGESSPVYENGQIYILDERAGKGGVGVEYYIRDAEGNIIRSDVVDDPVGSGGAEQPWSTTTIAMTPDDFFKIRGLKIYGAVAFKFSAGLPSDYDEAMLWMADAWQAGHKEIYPAAVNWT